MNAEYEKVRDPDPCPTGLLAAILFVASVATIGVVTSSTESIKSQPPPSWGYCRSARPAGAPPTTATGAPSQPLRPERRLVRGNIENPQGLTALIVLAGEGSGELVPIRSVASRFGRTTAGAG